jgi:DNA transposition AAA+ family ATPase
MEFKPVFTNTRNVRNFTVMMDALDLGAGEGRLGLVWGRAGRGKTRTCQWWHAHHGGVYLRVATVWRSSEMELLKALCRELGVVAPQGRRGPAFAEAVERLISQPTPVFLDEIDKMPRFFLDLVRDLSDLSGAPIILVGEEELVSLVKQNRRVWSRIYQQIEFSGIELADVVTYTGEAAGLKLPIKVASILHRECGGDFRLLRRNVLQLVQYCNANNTSDVTEQMVKVAVQAGVTGK